MQSDSDSRLDRVLSTALIWRLAQVVFVLAAALLYLEFGRFGAELQTTRAMSVPHLSGLLKLILVGLGIGICIGLALKNLSTGRVRLVIDGPTLLISLLAAAFFVAVSVSFDVAAIANTTLVKGPLGHAVVVGPLLPYVWIGFALASVIQPAKD
jgi:hypothetical protein